MDGRYDMASYHVSRVPVPPEPWVEAGYDYADCFELRLAEPDNHTAEQWVRAALEQASPAIRGIIQFVHGRLARFRLSSDPHSVLGWEPVATTRDAIQARGPALRAEILVRRNSATTATFTTFLFYKRKRTGLLWVAIGPLHRRIAPYLLARAASHLTRPVAA